MKKLMILTLTWASLFTTNAFADEMLTTTSLKEMPVTTTAQELPTSIEDMQAKYDLIIRNNNISSDHEYNNKTYYTKKINTEDLVIPDEVKENASRIYFLVEEWNSIIFYNKEMSADAVETNSVKKEYNYKIVDYVEWKDEYTFNTSDLVKDFENWEYKSVNITLVAEFDEWEKLYLSNSAYVNIADKASVLNNIKNTQEEWNTYFWYYDSNSLWEYLEKLWEKMSREDFKSTLSNAQNRLKSLKSKNEASKKELLNSIQKESDFEVNVDKFALYTETSNLLDTVWNAISSQLQKLRSYDLIDSIFNK